MGKETKDMVLAKEAVMLIKDIIESAVFLEENFFNSIEISENHFTILLKDKNNNCLEYSLSEVSCIFTDEITGLWEIEGNVFDYFEFVKEKNNEKYKELSKEEFINYIGKLYYLQYRCEEVFRRLREIEKTI